MNQLEFLASGKTLLQDYLFVLQAWNNNMDAEQVDYFATEALLMLIIEKQDAVNAFNFTDAIKADFEIQSLLQDVHQQLKLNPDVNQQQDRNQTTAAQRQYQMKTARFNG